MVNIWLKALHRLFWRDYNEERSDESENVASTRSVESDSGIAVGSFSTLSCRCTVYQNRCGENHSTKDLFSIETHDTTMPQHGASSQPLLTFLHQQLGDALRSYTRYGDDGVQSRYLRDDISAEQANRRGTVSRNLRESERQMVDEDTLDTEFGNLYASIHYFDGGILIHLLRSERHDVVFSVERSIGSDLGRFIEQCGMRLSGQ